MPTAQGTFEVVMDGEAPYLEQDELTLNRTIVYKEFSGGMVGKSEAQMLAAFTATPGSAGYVALEYFTGSVEGKLGSLVLQHNGVMNKGDAQLAVTIVPDSGAGELAGISGTMEINVDEGGHSYVLTYECN
jgi:ABC-type phosphate transport system substrate-binding protein